VSPRLSHLTAVGPSSPSCLLLDALHNEHDQLRSMTGNVRLNVPSEVDQKRKRCDARAEGYIDVGKRSMEGEISIKYGYDSDEIRLN
jgi:hypothetical protein